MQGPLDGVTVLDFTRLLPGPMAALCLADLGADVVKIEGIPHGDYARRMGADDEGSSISYVALNQNKRSIQVDHRLPEGAAVIRELIKSADVFIESSRPGSLAAHGLDAASLMALNPQLVYCSISAYGSYGALGNWPGHGYNIEANAGFVTVSEDPDGALRLPEYKGLIASLATGYQAALAIAASLLAAQRTGRGATIEMAAFDAGIAFDPVDATHALNGVPHDVTIGTRATPKYAAYKTKDGQALLLATIEGKFWVEFCQLVGRPDLIPEHRHDLPSDWGHDHPHLYDELSAIFATRTLGEWMRLLRTHPLPISAINPLSKVVDTEHFRDRAMTRTTVGPSGKTVPTIRPAVIYNSERLGPAGRWSELGEDTTDVLLKSGFDPEQIERLVAAGAIRQGDR